MEDLERLDVDETPITERMSVVDLEAVEVPEEEAKVGMLKFRYDSRR